MKYSSCGERETVKTNLQTIKLQTEMATRSNPKKKHFMLIHLFICTLIYFLTFPDLQTRLDLCENQWDVRLDEIKELETKINLYDIQCM